MPDKLRDSLFTPTRTGQALYIPTTRLRTLLRGAIAWERLGQRLFPTFSGVIMIEAGQQIYAAGMACEKLRRRRPVVVCLPQVARRQRQD